METQNELEVVPSNHKPIATDEFVKNSFKAVLKLHEQVVDAKEQTLEQLKSENEFLKESIKNIQDIYVEDRETIEILTKQIKALQDELEFTKRKYKLMWNQAVENYKK
jgi:cell division protein FtsB